jgi:Integrase core domain
MFRPGAAVLLCSSLVGCDKGSSSGPEPAIPPSAMTPHPAPVPTPTERPEEERIRAIIDGAKNDPPAEPEPPLDKSPAGVAKVLVGIAEFQRLVQQRLALGRESNDACMTKQEGRAVRRLRATTPSAALALVVAGELASRGKHGIEVAKELAEALRASREVAHASIADYIESFYNSARRHSSLGYVSPIEFELRSRVAAFAA